MQILLTYDVETVTPQGRKRLRQVAKVCTDYGQRVQNSVFELNIDPATLVTVKSKLNGIIEPKKDSIRIYNLGKHWERRVETMGLDDSYNPESDLLML
ncbi:CRISPR-associated endonuclease Cas2 [Peptoniphilus sp. EMRHCC_23]|uniref:CRISPR-associated endonuclease Cas2 n=1 Tax=Peptoniphilus TaxID=162289 RepID=UPI001C00577E|nr:CRISPR-associated endonuclease Cas2 [Peptoniphilus rachelemmaiella]